MAVHPRACGADAHRRGAAIRLYGSPPRVRGGCFFGVADFQALRFTPARAGRISAYPVRCCMVSVHPRACGADEDIGLYQAAHSGSPPRVRGG